MRLACSTRSCLICAVNETRTGRFVDTAVELVNAALHVKSGAILKFPSTNSQSELNEVPADCWEEADLLKAKPWNSYHLPRQGRARQRREEGYRHEEHQGLQKIQVCEERLEEHQRLEEYQRREEGCRHEEHQGLQKIQVCEERLEEYQRREEGCRHEEHQRPQRFPEHYWKIRERHQFENSREETRQLQNLSAEEVVELICCGKPDVMGIKRLVFDSAPTNDRNFKFYQIQKVSKGWEVWIKKNLSFELHPNGQEFRVKMSPEKGGAGVQTEEIITPYRVISEMGWPGIDNTIRRIIRGKPFAFNTNSRAVMYEGVVYRPDILYFNSSTGRFRCVTNLRTSEIEEFKFRSCVTDSLARTVIKRVKHDRTFSPVAEGDLELIMEVVRMSEGPNNLLKNRNLSPWWDGEASTSLFAKTIIGLKDLNAIRNRRRNRAYDSDLIIHFDPLQLRYLLSLEDSPEDIRKQVEELCSLKLDFIKMKCGAPELSERIEPPLPSFDDLVLTFHGKSPRNKSDVNGFTLAITEKESKKPIGYLMEFDRDHSKFILLTLANAFVVTELETNASRWSIETRTKSLWGNCPVIREWPVIRELSEMECFVHKGALFQMWLYDDEGRPSPSPLLLKYASDNADLVETFFIGKVGDWTDQRSAEKIKALQGANFKKVPFDWPSTLCEYLKNKGASSGYLWAHFEEQNAVITLDWNTLIHLTRDRADASSNYTVNHFRNTEHEVENVIAMKILQESLLKRITPGGTSTTATLESALRHWQESRNVSRINGWESQRLLNVLRHPKPSDTTAGSKVQFQAYPKGPSPGRCSLTEISEADSELASASESHEESAE